jgi:hypothetical protein
MIKQSVLMKWMEQELVAAIEWHTVTGINISKDALTGYEAGFKQGYLKALRAIQDHSKIRIIDTEK